MSRILTLFVGIAFFLLSVMGMIPGATVAGRLFGIFSATFINQVFYFVLGLFALSAWLKGDKTPQIFLTVAGLLLIFLGLAGFYYGEGTLFHLLTVNAADNVLHLSVGALLLYFAFLLMKR